MSETEENIVEVRDLVVKYGDRVVLDGLNFDIKRGENFVILGGSGSGKSTLLRNLVGLMRPASGHVLIEGNDIATLPDEECIEVRKRMGMCFQGSALFGSMTVGDNVALPLREHTKLEESTIAIVTKMKLAQVGLDGFEDYMPSELSGGMKKRAGLARAMAMDPRIIFYDEPSAGLDPVVGAGLDELIRTLQDTFGLTSVVVTHEMESVKLIADRVLMLHHGKVIALGTLEEVQNSDHEFVERFFARKPDDKEEPGASYIDSLTSRSSTL